ncbi:hypothetical protein [Bradyrhizobium sp. CCBAU 51753]|uniref:hypothetical protein n=1 Tax=Bradyrhizobium sp. CCBAU 51753 TaxID=1325100 RepID=UPI00188CBFA8|nr:hypothetical protein [Bradyrhizobium sp. CCBAU 51753]QOZ25290.1 hypothetical protein XH93_18105 [Bradyrhizobium sp. CCBAU 51753]
MHRAQPSPLPELGRVEGYWSDKPLAIVGTGPSLKGFDFSRFNIAGVRVLAVKEAIWDLPFAEEVFCLHRPWLIDREAELTALPTRKVFAVEPEIGRCPIIPHSLYLLRTRYAGYSDKPTEIQSGGNSGFGATNYAYLKRGQQTVRRWKWALFGFDYTDQLGEHYCADRYTWYQPGQNARYWKSWGDNFNDCKAQLERAGIDVMNASPISTVSAFPKCTIEDGLAWLTAR